MKNSRRNFLISSTTLAAALSTGQAVFAQAVTLEESDPLAKSLGYVKDATKADKVKYPKYVAGSNCSTCSLYQGKAGAASGPCPIYANKLVSSKGWCSTWVKKA